MKIEKAGKIIAAPKFLIFGKTGTGKTTWAAKAPKPLFMLAENQGAASIASSNPDALIINVKDWNDFREAAKNLPGVIDRNVTFGSISLLVSGQNAPHSATDTAESVIEIKAKNED